MLWLDFLSQRGKKKLDVYTLGSDKNEEEPTIDWDTQNEGTRPQVGRKTEKNGDKLWCRTQCRNNWLSGWYFHSLFRLDKSSTPGNVLMPSSKRYSVKIRSRNNQKSQWEREKFKGQKKYWEGITAREDSRERQFLHPIQTLYWLCENISPLKDFFPINATWTEHPDLSTKRQRSPLPSITDFLQRANGEGSSLDSILSPQACTSLSNRWIGA